MHELSTPPQITFTPSGKPISLAASGVIHPTTPSDGIICGNKYMIYEIAAYRGKKLSQNEQRLSIPTSFKCVFQNLSVVYEKGVSRYSSEYGHVEITVEAV
jgi:hypothetical protein